MRLSLLSTTTLAAAFAAGAFLAQPGAAWAQEKQQNGSTGQAQKSASSKAGQEKQEKVDLSSWSYTPLYAGMSVERFLDAEVYDQNGEQIGEVEDMIVSPQGKVTDLVIEAGGFLDIGDTHFAYPLKKASILTTDAVRVQFDEDEIENYSMFRNLDERPVTGRNWKITELLNDYAYLHDRRAYGWVDDVVIGRGGDVQAVIVSADATYGVGGPYAWPYYGYGWGWEPGLGYYEVPYSAEEVAVLDEFDPERMGAQQTASASQSGQSGAAAGGGQSGASAGSSEAGQIVGQKVVNAQGKKVGKVDNVVNESDERYVVIALGGDDPEVDKKMLVPRSEIEVKGDQVVWTAKTADKAMDKSGKQKQ